MRPAGFWIRFLASFLDGILLSVFFMILRLLGMESVSGWGDDILPHAVYAFALPLLWNGYTVGKRIVGIRIVRMDGRDPGAMNMLVRVLIADLAYAALWGIPLIISAFMVGLRSDKRSIHDLLAGTQVVHGDHYGGGYGGASRYK